MTMFMYICPLVTVSTFSFLLLTSRTYCSLPKFMLVHSLNEILRFFVSSYKLLGDYQQSPKYTFDIKYDRSYMIRKIHAILLA